MTKPQPEPATPCERQATSDERRAAAFLRLLVRNHAGVMSHICGLFARRSFNVDGILCLPLGDRTTSAILLAVDDDRRLDQLVRQLAKLEDVIDVRRSPESGAAFESVRGRLH